MDIKKIKIALVADWITNPGGDDKVLWELHEIFPKAPIFTTVFNPEKMSRYKNLDIRTTYLNNIPLAKSKHQLFVPLMFNALKNLDLSDYDIIFSSSHTVGKSITKPKGAIHICYCHTPLRYVWAPKIDDLGKRIKLGPLTKPLLSYLRKKDIESAESVDYFLANSHTIARRIKFAYGKDAKVIYPPVDTEKFKPVGAIAKKDYYFSAGRLIPYKKIDLIIKAFNQLGKKLLIAGTGPEYDNLKSIANDNIDLLGFVDDEKLIRLMQEAKAFIFAANEDFGIVPVEAMAAGTPVIAYGQGGATETVSDGKTGVLFEKQSVDSLSRAINKFEKIKIKSSDCQNQTIRFSKSIFNKEIINFIKNIKE